MTSDDTPVSGDESPSLSRDDWPLSNYLFLVSLALLVATGVAVTVSTQGTAEHLATFAYYSLVVGVCFRILERVGAELTLDEVAAPFGDHLGPFRPLVHRVQTVVQAGRSRVRTDRRRGVESAVHGIKLAAPLTFLGGLVLMCWWRFGARVAVPGRFVRGWLLATALLLGAYAVLSRRRKGR